MKFDSTFQSYEPANENNLFKETKRCRYKSYLIIKSFQWYRCKSDIAIFAWRVTYAHIPFKIFSLPFKTEEVKGFYNNGLCNSESACSLELYNP